MSDLQPAHILVAIGSRRDQICSVGSFARAEAAALAQVFTKVSVLEPDSDSCYPNVGSIKTDPDFILFHAPALHDRKRPWNPFISARRLRKAFPRAVFLPIVHEFSEAPMHWKLRQIALLKLSQGGIVNSHADYKGLSRWKSNLLRVPLGPTLFFEELLKKPMLDSLQQFRQKARAAAASAHGLDTTKKWILNPGLVTPGKGADFLYQLVPHLDQNVQLIIMGGLGPTRADQEFAASVFAKLKELLGERFHFVESPSDENFKNLLLASDLVVLPYDVGLSERRSSFLSAMCCGANVWTTTGRFSAPLELNLSGAHSVSEEAWRAKDLAVYRSIQSAIGESYQDSDARRIKNLNWSQSRTWQKRAQALKNYFASFAKRVS